MFSTCVLLRCEFSITAIGFIINGIQVASILALICDDLWFASILAVSHNIWQSPSSSATASKFIVMVVVMLQSMCDWHWFASMWSWMSWWRIVIGLLIIQSGIDFGICEFANCEFGSNSNNIYCCCSQTQITMQIFCRLSDIVMVACLCLHVFASVCICFSKSRSSLWRFLQL